MNNADVLKILNKVGEDFGWQIGSVPTNYVNGYMQAVRDCKSPFYGKEHIREDTKKVETNADRIRSMTDEELIAFIKHPCKTIKEITYPNRNCVFRCDECIEEWLKEKVEE